MNFKVNSKYFYYSSFSIIIFIISFLFNYNSINDFPSHKHNWAQCDRYALSLGFLKNGGDFFHPETFIYNNQFPDGDFMKTFETSITSVDFPIYDYCVSILMRVFNTTQPWCFKLFVFIYSIIGLFYLYKLISIFTTSNFKALIIILFTLSSPVFLSYQSSFLPTIPSLANCFIALYFLFSFYKFNIKKHFFYFIIFISIATLARLPFVMVLVAVICLEFLFSIYEKKIHLFKWSSFLVSIICIVGYLFYNTYLRNKYGSLFLNHIIPANNFDEFIEFLQTIYERWFYKYFSIIHYIMLFILTLFFLVNFLLHKIKLSVIETKLLLFSSILFAGCLIYFVLMNFQFLVHDYYFLDSFFIPFILFFIFLIIKLPNYNYNKINYSIYVLLSMSFIPALFYAHKTIKSEDFEFISDTKNVYNNGDKFLDSLNISRDAKILILGTDGANNPFILLNRKGYTMVYPEHDRIETALNWPFDYIILEHAKFIQQVYPNYPAILNKISLIAKSSKFSVYKKNENTDVVNFDSMFNLNFLKKSFYQKINFDSISSNYSNIDSLNNFCFSGKKSGFVDANQEFGFTFKFQNASLLNKSPSFLKFQSFFNSESPLNECLICVSIKNKEKDLYFFSNNLKYFDISNKWTKKQFIFSIPIINENITDFNIFIWNIGKNKLYYDDIEIELFQ